MKLNKVVVSHYWNFVDSSPVPIEPDATCLVGKNESGKTALLRAVYQLNPAYESHLKPNLTDDYPRWRLARDRRGTDLNKIVLVKGEFLLSSDELKELADKFDPALTFPLPPTTAVIAERTYGGDLHFSLTIDDSNLAVAVLEFASLSPAIRDIIGTPRDLDHFAELLDKFKSEIKPEDSSVQKAIRFLSSQIKQAKEFKNQPLPQQVVDHLQESLPLFFYFSEYSMLNGRLDLTDLLNKNEGSLTDDEHTAISLLRLAGATGKEFLSQDFEYRVSELEAAANLITQEVFKYWTTNEDLVVRLVSDSATVQVPQGQTVVHRYVDIRLNDLKHQVTTNLDRRSSGFRWFFSFIAAFSEFERSSEKIIVLLDEPGLNLHARAQYDFLRFIDNRLAPNSQILYTTHSPFMVDPSKLHRVRLVEDLTSRDNLDRGAVVSTDVLSVHSDTLFPLQAALGYDLAQNLFVGPHNLVVEGPSDFIYLTTLSEHLATLSREPLNDAWTIVPVGGADKIPTFVALLGAHVDVTVLLDASNKGNQRLTDLANRGLLDPKRILTPADVIGTRQADIEDLFAPAEYLQLFNAAFGMSLSETDISGTDPIVRKLARHLGQEFNHDRPATELLRNKIELLPKLGTDTISRFERLFHNINATIST